MSYNDSYIPFKDLESATGEIPFGMTNDYMFRAVLQKNNKVLRGLVISLLQLQEEDVQSAEITNPCYTYWYS